MLSGRCNHMHRKYLSNTIICVPELVLNMPANIPLEAYDSSRCVKRSQMP
jgi:hypothetical protein